MKIYVGWYAAYAVLCVCAHPSRDRPNEMYISSSRSFNPKSTANGFEKQLSATELFKIFEDSEDFEEEEEPSTMRAIVTRAKTRPVLLPLIIEPEAEMLPAGYRGVKPPGVTHMELAFLKPQISPSGRKSATLRASTPDDENSGKSSEFNRDNDAHYAATKHKTQAASDDHANDSLTVVEVGSKGDTRKQNEMAEYREVSGVSKSHSENENRAKNHKEEVVKKKEATYETGDDHEKARNTAGYSNVYHKDEFKKDADFYNNGHQGGHFEKHGRYDERHAAAKGKYAKGRSNGSRFIEEANKQANRESSKKRRETTRKPKVTLRQIP
ncbi:uncharacterized protein LOC105835911 [Monomorium pharaonis]|uniref:uncharacterized protein LOC105835911 n=1 Tax=Monomorium pharaonis TaxID=307658 RepID=UPI00063F8FB1|nr:uncharacterized protein LOC105835911 [Monomorium pharaonis]